MDLVLKNCKLTDKIGEYFIKIEDGKINEFIENRQIDEAKLYIYKLIRGFE